MADSKTNGCRSLNINVGLMGHVDSGKTSLAKCLSQVKSTAAFDKHPQSQERGITIDLGFSSLKVDLPEHLKVYDNEKKELQFTLVDCPGHGSLLRTVIGGSQIIDIVLLVIDVTKGVQTQTAECLILAEITCKRMIVVLNKIDLLAENKRDLTVEKMTKKMRATLNKTPFKECPIVSVSTLLSDSCKLPTGVSELIDTMTKFAEMPERYPNKPFVFSVDHCFAIHGQGTVLTGTVIQGKVHINDLIEIPSLKLQKKIKSMQMFRRNIEHAEQGDRLGICVKQLDPSLIERTIICAPDYSQCLVACVVDVSRIKYYKGDIATDTKFHISIGYETVVAKIVIFSSVDLSDNEFDISKEYLFNEVLLEKDKSNDNLNIGKQFLLLQFERPVITTPCSLVIGSKLEIDPASNLCRLAFHGDIIYYFTDKNYSQVQLSLLKVYKVKEKSGIVDRVVNEHEVIGRNIFKKDSNIERFVGFKVHLSTGELGIIDRSFGKSGKIAIRIPGGIKSDEVINYKRKSKKSNSNESGDNAEVNVPVKFSMKFKKYCFDKDKKIVQ